MTLDENKVIELLRQIEDMLLELKESNILHVRSNADKALNAIRQSIFNLGEFPSGILQK